MRKSVKARVTALVCVAVMSASVLNVSAEWRTVGGNRYFYYKGAAVTENSNIDGVRYVFDKNGVCKGKFSGMSPQNGKIYYYENGVKKSGWITFRDSRYCFGGKEAGYAAYTGVKTIANHVYVFGGNGKLLSSKEISVNGSSFSDALAAASGKKKSELTQEDYNSVSKITAYNISDLSEIQKCVNAGELDLRNSHVLDISALSKLTRLTKLNLTSNFIAAADPSCTKRYINDVIRLTNKERSKNGLNAFISLYDRLNSAALLRADELVKLYSHTRPDGTDCFTAFDEKGVSYYTAGENIAYGYGTPKAVVNGWMNSPGHRANILNPSFNYIGVGVDVKSRNYVQCFAGSDVSIAIEDIGSKEDDFYTQIHDITPLKNLTELRELYLSGNEISDISALAGLTNLTVLELGGNEITDYSAVRNLPNYKAAWEK